MIEADCGAPQGPRANKFLLLVLSLTGLLALSSNAGAADAKGDAASGSHDWAKGAIQHALEMRDFFDTERGNQPTPPLIPRLTIDFDPSGKVASYQPGGPTVTRQNAFFTDLGTNQRTCFTCHQPAEGWTISASSVRERFYRSRGTDPLFRLVDGATCPTDDVSTFAAKRSAYGLLIDKALIRIGLPLPAERQFRVVSVDDPYGCTTDPVTGLTSDKTSGIVSVYRRVLPSTNLGFLSAIMWDGREPDLRSQATDATLIHAQAEDAPSATQVDEIVGFENGVFTAQAFDRRAHDLGANGATGGPKALFAGLTDFYIGINDPLGMNPRGTPFDQKIFDLYDAWDSLLWDSRYGNSAETRRREAIVRGEQIFNSKPVAITGVAGLNDVLGKTAIDGFCGTCHDTPNVGNHSVKAPLNIGIADAGAGAPPALDISGLPVFTLKCTADGPLKDKVFVVTDPGRALITGSCADIGKVKGPILRALAARAPYFHNGAAATLDAVVEFYDQRFGIGFTEQEKQDLVTFLNAL